MQESGLRLGWRSVDLVGEHDVGEDRAPHEAEHTTPRRTVFFDDLRTGDVGGHQVGRELDPAELEVQRLGHGRHEQGLGEPVHQVGADFLVEMQQRLAVSGGLEHVAVGEEGRQETLDDVVLADDSLLHLLAEGGGHLPHPVEQDLVSVPNRRLFAHPR